MERVECTGKCYYVLALALFQFIECGMLLLIIPYSVKLTIVLHPVFSAIIPAGN